MKIVHLIPSLNSGGAEAMLYKLIRNKTPESNYQVEIITLDSGGFYKERLKEMKIPIHELNIRTRKNPFKTILRLIKILNSADIIQSWMYHSDFIAFIFGKVLLRKKVIWGVRRSYLDKQHMKKGTYYTAKICSYVSKFVDGIISCTIIGKENHEHFGYTNPNFTVIPNGFDLNQFEMRGDLQAIRKPIRLLNVARWEPLKDHQTLLSAMNILKGNAVQFELYLVGKNIDDENIPLKNIIKDFNLEKEIKLLGVRNDIPELMKNSDIYISSSLSEGFPNVIGEAMASGLYCVATDAGDTKYIINKLGTVVSIQNPRELSEAILSVINKTEGDLFQIRKYARERIREEYSIQNVVKQYEEMYEKICRI